MATEEHARDVPWQDIERIRTQWGAIHGNTVLHYFSDSWYFDKTSNNSVLYTQIIHNPNMTHILGTREAFEGRLKTMSGLEYMVVQEPADPVNGTGVWVIRKQTRRKRSGEEDLVTPLNTYFVIGVNIYEAPSVADIMSSFTLSVANNMSKFFSKASTISIFTPTNGNTYFPPATSRPKPTDSQLGQMSKESTPLPDALQNTKKALPSTNNSTFLNTRLFEETLNIHLKYGDEFMDDNPVTGEPGAFHLSSTGRKDKGKLAIPAAGTKPSAAGGNDKAGKAAPPPALKTLNIDPARKGSKGEKTPTKSPGSAKPKRKKSKALGSGVGSSGSGSHS